MKCTQLYEISLIKSITCFDIFGIKSKQDFFLIQV